MSRRTLTLVVLATAALLSLPAVLPLLVHNRCGDVVVRSAFRDKSHYHHVSADDPARSARSQAVRGCITRARNRIYLSLVELTPVVVAAVWLVVFRSRRSERAGSG